MSFLCWLGIHSWLFDPFRLERRCERCGREEYVKEGPYGTTTFPLEWIKKEKK